MLSYFEAGGFLMWVLAALSVAAVAVIVERLLFFRRASTNPERLEAEFAAACASGRAEDARGVVFASNSSLHRIFQAALTHWDVDREGMGVLVEQEVRREVYRWEKRLLFLEMTGRIAPLLGLLGTVIGMMEMFAGLHSGGRITATAVTGGIWKALFTTVAGLSVAIPALFLHGFLSSRVDSQEECLRRGADFLIRERFPAPANAGLRGKGAP